jgi:two-component system cell cycle sensor histidine kinase/response regulator CckA
MSRWEENNPMPSAQPLRALILEDNPADAELAAATLRRAGYQPSFAVVDSPAQFERQLQQTDYDIILSDYNLRSWTALGALETLRKTGKGIPLIVVAKSVGDEAAAECIREGAADYVLRDRLDRLPRAVERALRHKAHGEEAARLEELIRRAKKDLELTFDTVPDVVLLLDKQSRIQRANRAAAALRGLMPAQLIGRSSWEVVHGQPVPPLDYPLQRMLATGTEVRGDIEEPLLGRVFDATATPLADGSGGIRGCVEVLRDITARKNSEQALRASEQRYRAIVEGAAEGILAADSETRKFVYANPAVCRMLGYSEQELVRLGVHDIHPAAEWEGMMAESKAQADGEKTAGSAIPCLRKDGATILVDVTTAPVVIGGRRCDVAFLTDVTERESREAQRRQSQRMEAVRQLAGEVAHDFNNLLMAISGYSELLLARLGKRDPMRKHVEEIRKAGDRTAELTRQLLAFSRRLVLAPEALDLNAVIAYMLNTLRRLIGEDVELVSVAAPELGRVKADPGQMEQVVLSLALNAREAMTAGGKLRLETANLELQETSAAGGVHVPAGRYVTLEVSDTGCGIDAEALPRIFEPFFTTKEGRKGLGLATAHGIVTQSGGYVAVSSQPGQGTTFRIYFPRIEAPAEPLRRTPDPSGLPSDSADHTADQE